ncbi:MAG: hypothetical protein KC636_25570, partial [Myxococcales bacterium]|nr:hypothetical protein [Myxococcales bacterium]
QEAIERRGPRELEARVLAAEVARSEYLASGALAAFSEAERGLQRVLVLALTYAPAYEQLARLYLDRARTEPSYRLLAERVVGQGVGALSRVGVESAGLREVEGLVALARGDPRGALAAFEAALRVDEGRASAHLHVAYLALGFRDYDLAARHLQAAMKDRAMRRDADVWLAFGVARRGLDDLAGARAAYQRAAALAPADPRPWYNLGLLEQWRASQLDAGGALFESALRAADRSFEEFVALAGARPEYAQAVDRARARQADITGRGTFGPGPQLPSPELREALRREEEAERAR